MNKYKLYILAMLTLSMALILAYHFTELDDSGYSLEPSIPNIDNKVKTQSVAVKDAAVQATPKPNLTYKQTEQDTPPQTSSPVNIDELTTAETVHLFNELERCLWSYKDQPEAFENPDAYIAGLRNRGIPEQSIDKRVLQIESCKNLGSIDQLESLINTILDRPNWSDAKKVEELIASIGFLREELHSSAQNNADTECSLDQLECLSDEAKEELRQNLQELGEIMLFSPNPRASWDATQVITLVTEELFPGSTFYLSSDVLELMSFNGNPYFLSKLWLEAYGKYNYCMKNGSCNTAQDAPFQMYTRINPDIPIMDGITLLKEYELAPQQFDRITQAWNYFNP